ncbi:MAG: hypothetical protein J1E56_07325 [Ruminococcus sp.]|nr:hypothetical protein [Ruminococcus sp.]
MPRKIERPEWAPENIGEILRDMRKACGINGWYDSEAGHDFIGEIVAGPKTLQQIETGKRNPSERDIKDIVGALIHTTGNKLRDEVSGGRLGYIPTELKGLIDEMYADWERFGHDKSEHISYYRTTPEVAALLEKIQRGEM